VTWRLPSLYEARSFCARLGAIGADLFVAKPKLEQDFEELEEMIDRIDDDVAKALFLQAKRMFDTLLLVLDLIDGLRVITAPVEVSDEMRKYILYIELDRHGVLSIDERVGNPNWNLTPIFCTGLKELYQSPAYKAAIEKNNSISPWKNAS